MKDQKLAELTSENFSLKAKLAFYESPHQSGMDQPTKKKKRTSGIPHEVKKKRGGSKKGKSTIQKQVPDRVVYNFVHNCLGCGKNAGKNNQSISYLKQVYELPHKIELELQLHHIYKYACDCGAITEAGNPTLEKTILGSNLLSFISSARNKTGASFENISSMIIDLSKKCISQTTLNRGLSAVSKLLETERDKIANEVLNSSFINIDETGHKLVLEGKRSQLGSKKIWVWVFGNQNASYYHLADNRGHKALEEAFRFLEGKNPPLMVVDGWKAHSKFKPKQMCRAHLLRDSKELEDTCYNGKILHDSLTLLFKELKELPSDKTQSIEIQKKTLAKMNSIAMASSCKNTEKLRKLLRRHGDEYLTFLQYPNIPMENGRAERLLKSVIIHRKRGSPLRSYRAMNEYGIMLTVLNTWKERGMNIFENLKKIIEQEIMQAIRLA